MANHKIIKTVTTSLVLDAELLFVSDLTARSIEIEIYTFEEPKANETYVADEPGVFVDKKVVQLKAYNDLTLQGDGKVVFDKLTNGKTYWLRSRLVDNSGQFGVWSDWQKETAGDNTNETTFSTKSVVNSNSSTTARILITTLPKDFSHFEWAIKKVDRTSVTNTNISSYVPTAIEHYPDADTIPYRETSPIAIGGDTFAELTISESNQYFYSMFVRSVDQSGNYSPLVSDYSDLGKRGNGWNYVGTGYISALDPKKDWDDVPPDATSHFDTYGSYTTGAIAQENWIG